MTKKQEMRKQGERLRQLRQEKGMTVEDLCKRLGGVNKTTLQSYERGESPLRLKYLSDLCDIFGVSADYLTGAVDTRDSLLYAAAIKTGLSGESIGYLSELNSRQDRERLPLLNELLEQGTLLHALTAYVQAGAPEPMPAPETAARPLDPLTVLALGGAHSTSELEQLKMMKAVLEELEAVRIRRLQKSRDKQPER